jgi:ATP-dependent DNA helicase RecG
MAPARTGPRTPGESFQRMTDLAPELGTTEHDTLEFKRDLSNRDAVRKAICALANDLPGQGGGVLLIGVNNDATARGIVVDDAALLAVTAVRDEGLVLPRPVIRVRSAEFAGVPVIRVDVTASDFPPVRFKGTPYVRVGPSSRQAHPAEERVLVERRQAADITFDQRPVRSATTDDLDLEFFASTYLPAAVSAEVREENQRTPIEQLASLRLSTPEGTPTVAGIVVLAYEPVAQLPGAYVQFVRYAGVDVAADVHDQAEIQGNLSLVLSKTQAKLESLITTSLVETGDFRQRDVPNYPLDALRECVVNAVVHRTYEANASVRVIWFDDRVEILNPGGPYGVVTDENFGRVNDYRNPTLAEAARNLGYMNRFGRGVSLVRERLKANGNPPPEYAIEPHHWSVTIRARP